jgi:hypothetical protein
VALALLRDCKAYIAAVLDDATAGDVIYKDVQRVEDIRRIATAVDNALVMQCTEAQKAALAGDTEGAHSATSEERLRAIAERTQPQPKAGDGRQQ